MEELYEELQELIKQKIESGTAQATVSFSAVSALAGLLSDKGIINYDDFIKAFIANLSSEQE